MLNPDAAEAALPISVNDTADRPDRSIGGGTCATGAGKCTLRAAIHAPGANHGFLVRDATENGTGLDQVFHSREKGTDNPPRIVLTFGS